MLDGATSCQLLLPVEDGSVRVLCTLDNQELNTRVRAHAFESKGISFAGWPVDLEVYNIAGRMVGDDLTIVASRSGGYDVVEEGQPSHQVGVVSIAADGSIRSGVLAPIFRCCGSWVVGHDGIAYGAASVGGPDEGSAEVSRITALDLSGVRAGWPVSFDGIASGPAFGPGRRIVLTVGSLVRGTSRVLVFDRDGSVVSAVSAELPIATADSGVDCVAGMQPPLVAQDGTIFVLSEIDRAVFALDPSLAVMRGWPYRPVTPLVRPDPQPGEEGINCYSLALPVVGPDSTLYLPLQARDATVGGSIVAVGPDGRVRPGWPVELRRPGSEFWSVVVGTDGTVYALAIEPEPSDTSSASILAIAPDSSVLYTTTIIDP